MVAGRGSKATMSCVLIAEDDDDVREFMELLLSTSGYETMSAADGIDALEKMRQRLPCLVRLDLQMPRMDGWQFRVQQLRDPDSPRSPSSASLPSSSRTS